VSWFTHASPSDRVLDQPGFSQGGEVNANRVAAGTDLLSQLDRRLRTAAELAENSAARLAKNAVRSGCSRPMFHRAPSVII
jgi:hypothetical protein